MKQSLADSLVHAESEVLRLWSKLPTPSPSFYLDLYDCNACGRLPWIECKNGNKKFKAFNEVKPNPEWRFDGDDYFGLLGKERVYYTGSLLLIIFNYFGKEADFDYNQMHCAATGILERMIYKDKDLPVEFTNEKEALIDILLFLQYL